MPYYNNDDLFRYFTNYIQEKANKKIEKLKQEIAEEKERSVEQIRHEQKKNIFRGLDLELSDLNSEYKSRMNKVRTEYSKELMEKRSELLNSIISEVQAKLVDFVKTDKYKKLVKKQLKSLEKDFCSKEVEFRIKINDEVVKAAIENNYQGNFKIKEVPEIEIGGFSALCFKLGVMTDFTIDTRLNEKKQWLYEHSKLAASI
ncbi:MAG: V-type ATP synthase subunit E [Bacillota bacterium]